MRTYWRLRKSYSTHLMVLAMTFLIYKTRMTTLKISDDQTNIDKYRLAANITDSHGGKAIISRKKCMINMY